ncbi:exodeoxyribonuclease VII large subunit [Aquicoccus sp. G2-2]|uniref:exodeoxyribonuclease VII large subunit n=1 Tax=Aquicoccus sp. G2-2 TaxID=3092120 RepID=UPI002ADFCBEC|nr:exodeoxyribonuclease VII large subunit [Aquicoccus sp. G2-2]MEA1114148.1 exodeoxyribonuclease VII large subunit [Aquicoccus sp. G2-2]
MADLIEDESPKRNQPEFTVSELSGAVKRAIEGGFGHVRVRGEVGRVVVARTGHMYFDLKDDRNVIAAVSWKGQVARLAHRPEEGMEVIATGRLTTYGPQSKYQLNVEQVEPAGEGALMALLEKRKKALAAEGLFATERKRALPYLPEIIGVVTSPSGAVIRDILHRLRDRFPRKVLIWPVAVQGERCAPEVVRAIAGFNALAPDGRIPRPDLIIVARGGGSIEDLWGFNEESVARAAAASDIPLISAVGHETDTTLIDYVSDKRAPTPTAAAELAVPVRLELLAWVEGQSARMANALGQGVAARRQRLRDLARALPRAGTLLETPRQRFDRAGERLPAALTAGVQKRRVRLFDVAGPLRAALLTRLVAGDRRKLESMAARLNFNTLSREMRTKREDYERLAGRMAEAGARRNADWRRKLDALDRLRETLGYKETLKRGYAVVRGEAGVLTSKAAAEVSPPVQIEFADGKFTLGAGATGPKRRSPDAPKGGGQGSLFE